MTASAPRNRLAEETSPYLLQHAANPVDWYPWGDEALQRARAEGKPILLSIGYSACHWCHVMAHESFEDADTAALMNREFINIKVDREERPDLDKIYQLAHQLLTQRPGGWPLTVFLCAEDQTPFFAGTYFPKTPRYGMPSFKDLLGRVAQAYRERHGDVLAQGKAVQESLARLGAAQHNGNGKSQALSSEPLFHACQQLENSLDKTYGGFGRAPKFPHLTDIALMLHCHRSQQLTEALDQALFSLKKMALGGIFDHLGGGFCRYSVDEQWMIPHFEKMLYDNGPALSIYAQAWQISREPLFHRIARDTANWVMRDMQSLEGGYYSSLDADSEGEEGRFYVWMPKQVQALLGEDYPLFATAYGLDRKANFEGHWHLHAYHERAELAEMFDLPLSEINTRLERAQKILFAAREKRVHPGRDEKILTSWNALMIKGMAEAGRIFHHPAWIDSAERALDFIAAKLWQNGRLLATYKDGKAHLNAYLDDYAFLLDALLSLLQVRWRDADLRFAIELADVLLEQFQDPDNGGFYFTAADHEQLIQRPKPYSDESLPAGNGIAAQALGRLGHLLGEQRYLDAAEAALHAAWPSLHDLPYAHASLLLALADWLHAPETVVLRGHDPEQLHAWQQICQQGFHPQRLCYAIPAEAADLPGLLAHRQAPAAGCLAYICQGQQCRQPVADEAELRELLD